MEKGGEPAGARRFRFEWAYRPADMRRVIAGFPEKVVVQFCSRRAQITKTTLALADQHEKDRGHAPGQRVLASMGRFANAMTRRAKGTGTLDFTALLRGWERASRAAELETPRDLARTIWHTTPRASALTGARGDTGRRTRTEGWAARAARGTHACAGTCGHGRRGRRSGAGARVAIRRRAPHLAREQAAALPGADLGQLQTQLHAGAAGG